MVMRKVIAGVMMSLDGVMQAPGPPEEHPSKEELQRRERLKKEG